MFFKDLKCLQNNFTGFKLGKSNVSTQTMYLKNIILRNNEYV